MPSFSYVAINERGEEVTGSLEAGDSAAAKRSLESQNLMPIKVADGKASANTSKKKSRKEALADSSARRKVTLRDLIDFTRQLATLIRSGVPILSGLETLAVQAENLNFRDMLTQVADDISGGEDLSAALSKHPKVFNELYVNSVMAGEASGILDGILIRISDVMKRDLEIRQRVKGALRYPIIVITGMTAAFFIMVTMVVPKFVKIFEQAKLELPLPTVALMLIADIVIGYWWLMIGVTVATVVFFRWFVGTPAGRLWWDGILLRLPIFGTLVLQASITRFTAMFETLSRSGLPILQIFKIVANAIGNVVLGNALSKAGEGIEQGKEVAVSLEETGFFPPLVIKMISVGEASGAMDEMLSNISEYYDEEVRNTVDGLTGMIEPVLTLGMGVMVLFLALAIFLPMWDMTKMAGL